MSSSSWSTTSWKSKPAAQQARYPDQEALELAVGQLTRLPPLVTSWEIEALKGKLARAAKGEVFVLQGGDCAESFDDCESSVIAAKLKILLQMSLILVHGTKKEVVRIGRFAGQYAKPRSADEETKDGVTLPCYRGDLVNHPGFTLAERTPDPQLLLRGYERAALTLNFIRSLADGGFVTVFEDDSQSGSDTSGSAVRARRFDANGAAQGNDRMHGRDSWMACLPMSALAQGKHDLFHRRRVTRVAAEPSIAAAAFRYR